MAPETGRPRGALILAAVLAATAGLLSTPGPAAAQRSMAIDRFQARIVVQPDGELEVLESIQVDFQGSWNGIFRTIPVEYRVRGFSKRLYLDVVSVSDGGGSPLRHEESMERHYRKIKVWVPGAQDAVKEVNIRYRVPNALLFFEDHDELYWNVTGDEWEVPIREVTAFVELPDGATNLRASAFTGSYGSTESDAEWERIDDGYVFQTTEGLEFREGLTVVVGWDPGVVERPSALEKATLFLRANWLFLLPLLATGLMARLWWVKGKDPSPMSISARYEPPEGMSAAEVGTLVDGSPDMRDITASLVELAVRGYVRIEEVERDGLAGFLQGDDYRFVALQDPAAWHDLPEHELRILDGIFSRGTVREVKLSDLQNEFYTELPGIQDAIFERLVEAGYYAQRPDKVRNAWLGGAALLLGGGVFGAILLAQWLVMSELTAILSAVLTAVPVGVFGFLMPARTVRGARQREAILGFEEFLDRVESERYRRMITSPEMFERYLPFAMALGVEGRWARAFEDIYTEPPDWYVGAHGGPRFHTTSFEGDLGSMSSAAGSAMASSPRSAGSSGFSGGGGGGFSGGGFGGGGGGGF